MADAANHPHPTDPLEQKLEQERVAALFEQSGSVVVANLGTGSLYSWVLASHGFSQTAWLWLAALAVVVASRVVLYRRFAAVSIENRVPSLWIRRYGVAIFVTGCLWGLIGSLAITDGTIVASFVTIAVLAGMVGGSVATCAVSLRVFLLFSVPTLVPPSLALMTSWGSEGTLLGFLLFLYGAIVTRSVVQINRVILESIRHRFENERLLLERENEKQQIEESEAQLRTAYDKLEATHSDLVEQRGLVDRERDISARLRELDRLKDEFLANTSHELRTPLYGISGLAEALIEEVHGPIPARARADLALVVGSAQRLSRLVDNILDFAKLRHEGMPIEPKPIDLHSLADIVLTLGRSQTKNPDVELRNRIEATLPPVLADEDRIQQVLHNLVSNAIKFTAKGSITLTAWTQGEQMVLAVEDTGPGIDPADQERIFKAFEQGDPATQPSLGGTGLGLAISQKIVEMHGGELTIDSAPGRGATFSFTLPIAGPAASAPVDDQSSPVPPIEPAAIELASSPALAAADPAVALEVSAAPPPAPSASETSSSAITPSWRARILAVDDEPINLRILENFLTDEPIELHLADNAEQALETLDSTEIDLLLVDVMMPKISGFELCKKVRRKHDATQLPLLFLTARGRDQDVTAGFSVGANDYLVKPFSKPVLLSRIYLHLRLLEAHRDLGALVAAKIAELKVLRGLLPICASCKKIRDDDGDWNEMEDFVAARAEVEFSHGFCPDCLQDYLDEATAQSTTLP